MAGYENTLVCSGFLPTGVTVGDRAQTVDGCRAIKLTGGLWSIEAFGDVPEDQRILTLTPGPGTDAVGHTVDVVVSSGGGGSLVVDILLDKVSTYLPMYFKLERRPHR